MADEVRGTHNNYEGQAELVALTDESVAAIGAASGGGGGPVTIADGASVTEGSIADPAISTDAPGTISAKLRGLVKLLVNLLSRWPATLTAGGNLKTALQESIPAGANNIGDVDVLTVADVAQLPTTIGAKSAANSLAVVLPTDQGAIPISDNSGSLTMDSVQLPTTLGQKTRANSLSVAQASDATGVNAPQMQGAAADGAAATGNPILTGGFDGTNAQTFLTSPAGRQLIAIVGTPVTDGLTQSALYDLVDTQRALAASVNVYNGVNLERRRTATIFKNVSLAAGTTETTIWTPAAGKKFRLMGFILTSGAASTLTLKDNTGGATIFTARGATDVPISPVGMGNGILSGAANNVLTVTRGTSATLDGVVFGTEE